MGIRGDEIPLMGKRRPNCSLYLDGGLMTFMMVVMQGLMGQETRQTIYQRSYRHLLACVLFISMGLEGYDVGMCLI